MHWADVIAKELVERSESPIIATGISPTGILHVGSLREAITGESVRSAVKSMGKSARMIYLIDSFDPLRKRYDFLPEEYEKYTGIPICNIPCPCGEHKSYAHHFVQPFLDAMGSLGVECDIIWTNELYESGAFAECIDDCLNKRKEIINILHDVSGKPAKSDYSPYNPLCSECGRFAKPIFESYKFPYIEYECSCGHCGKADVRKAQGKLTWRCEWPAKWKIFGTSAEPFGKDHAAAGGSYDTGKRIAKEIFNIEPPYPVPYEFVQLKMADAKGKSKVVQMHKSTGSKVTGIDAIRMMPPEVLNYLFLRVSPTKAIDFDTGMGCIDMSDEYDRVESDYFSGDVDDNEENTVRAYEIAQHNHVPKKQPMQVSCKHLVNVVQMSSDFKQQQQIISRTKDISNASSEDIKRIERRISSVEYWVEHFAPENVKFSVSETIPESLKLTDEERAFMMDLADSFSTCDWDGDTISSTISDVAKASPIGSKGGYSAIYRVIIGKNRGPRAGNFLADMDRDFVTRIFRQAAQ